MSLVDPLTPAMRRRVNAMAEWVVAEVLSADLPTPLQPLSPSQREVIDRLRRGERQVDIARSLNITRSAVSDRVKHIRRKGHDIPTGRGAK